MISGCCGGEEKSSLFIQRIIQRDLRVLSKHTLPKIIIFSPVLASNSSQILAAYRIKFFFNWFSWIQFINYAKYILCTRTKKIYRMFAELFFFRLLPKNYFCACYKTVIITWFFPPLTPFRKPIIFYYD